MLEGLKVVTAQEMARIDQLAGSAEQFMENAAHAIAHVAIAFIQTHHLEKQVTLLIGKGNKGGDAFATGALLLAAGYAVSAWPIYPLNTCSPLCQKMAKKFQSQGGKIVDGKLQGLLIDGLSGTGFHGMAEGPLLFAIQQANGSSLPIIAIDIPSGVDGNTGQVGSTAIRADLTVFLELPKIGCFLEQGWNHVGELVQGTFGLEEKYREKATPTAYLLDEDDLPFFLPPIKRSRHKYEAGYLLAFAGSKGMSGAAIMASYSALRSGAGIVRLFHPTGDYSAAPYELICEEWDGKTLKRPLHESTRARAMLIGPGMGRTPIVKKTVHLLLKNIPLPCVIDADALYFLAQNPKWKVPKHTVLTPHRGEMKMLLGCTGQLADVQAFAEKKNATIVLKGAPTIVFHPERIPLIITKGDPGMATAGSGDVLTGIIGGFLAQGLDTRTAAIAAAALHGMAGELAATDLTSYCMTATDIIAYLPDAFSEVI